MLITIFVKTINKQYYVFLDHNFIMIHLHHILLQDINLPKVPIRLYCGNCLIPMVLRILRILMKLLLEEFIYVFLLPIRLGPYENRENF